MIRKASVAGLFYDDNSSKLRDYISQLLDDKNKALYISDDKRKTVSAVVPHAGYIYSAKTASYAFSEIAQDGLADTIIIIGPNHTGNISHRDEIFATTGCDFWQTPLGEVEVDQEFITELMKENKYVEKDDIAHKREHSIEVEIPFLQYISSIQNKSFKIVPIIMNYQYMECAVKLAKDIKKVMDTLNRDTLIIASTDLTHYEDSQSAYRKDKMVMDAIENMDINMLVESIQKEHITMCGYGPVMTAITFGEIEKSNISKVLNYSNSGDVNLDYSSVVGYTSAIIEK